MKLTKVIPLTLKADTLGTLEALEKEVVKIKTENVIFKIIKKRVGGHRRNGNQIGPRRKGRFNRHWIQRQMRTESQRSGGTRRRDYRSFDIIYKMTEWLENEAKKRKPKVLVEETTGKAKILRCFSREKDRQVVGGRVLEGLIATGETVKILRRDFEIGKGDIIELQTQKIKTRDVGEGKEFGLLVASKVDWPRATS